MGATPPVQEFAVLPVDSTGGQSVQKLDQGVHLLRTWALVQPREDSVAQLAHHVRSPNPEHAHPEPSRHDHGGLQRPAGPGAEACEQVSQPETREYVDAEEPHGQEPRAHDELLR